MNKRKHKKQTKYIIQNINKIKLDKDEFLLFRFNKQDYALNVIGQFVKHIKENLTNKVIFMPSDISVTKVSSIDNEKFQSHII